jgi:hypothetical protein
MFDLEKSEIKRRRAEDNLKQSLVMAETYVPVRDNDVIIGAF